MGDKRSRQPAVGGQEAFVTGRDGDGQGARHIPRALPRTVPNDSRASKRPRSDSPRTDVPGTNSQQLLDIDCNRN
jgi:hypothetical protein